MNYQKDFVERVLKSDRDFLLTDDLGNSYRFLQAHVGNAKFIYGINNYRGNPVNFYNDAKIAAIANKNEVYYVTEFLLGTNYTREVRETGKDFYEYKKEVREQVDKLAETLFEQLPTDLVERPPFHADIRQEAKDYLIDEYAYGHKEIDKLCKVELTDEDVLNIFCGTKTIEETVTEIVERDKTSLAEKRVYDLEFEESLKDPELLQDWEVGIAKAVASVPHAKNLTVKQDFSEVKIEPDTLIGRLKGRIFGKCDYIWEILYNGKTLYNRCDYKDFLKKPEKHKTEYER